MAVIKQMTGKADVTAPGSSRRPPVSLEHQRLSGQHFPRKIIAESQKNWISRSCKVCIPAEQEIDRLSNAPKKRKRHGHESSYKCTQCMVTLCIDPCFRFIISTRIILLSINLGRDKIVTTDYVAIYMHGIK